MALRKYDCSTCKHKQNSFFCNDCKANDLWELHPDYEEKPEEPKDVIVPFVIQLQLPDESCMSLANAICKHCRGAMNDGQTALIYLEELVEHIDSHIRAERKWLEYYERSQKGE